MTSVFKDKPYWSTLNPEAIAAGPLTSIIQRYGFPSADGEERQAFSAWWNEIPTDVIHEAARLDTDLVFEVTAYVENPLAALDLYRNVVLAAIREKQREQENTAGQKTAGLKAQLDDARREAEHHKQEVLRLKAEIYDLMHEKENRKGSAHNG